MKQTETNPRDSMEADATTEATTQTPQKSPEKSHICLIGDYYRDLFYQLDDKGERNKITTCPGGIRFIEEIVNAKIKFKILQEEERNTNYQEPYVTRYIKIPEIDIKFWDSEKHRDSTLLLVVGKNSVYSIGRELKSFQEGTNEPVYRWIETLEPPLELGYQEKPTEDNENCIFLEIGKLIEDIKNSEPEQTHEKESGSSRYFLLWCGGAVKIQGQQELYKGIFENEESRSALLRLLINQSGKTSTNEKATSDYETDNHRSRRGRIPRFFWVTHRVIPEFLLSQEYAIKVFNEISENTKPHPQNQSSQELNYQAASYMTPGDIQQIYDKNKEISVIFLVANTLRREGAYISRHVSWERAAQDYLREFYSNPMMKEIRSFRHIITRFGLTGVIYSFKTNTINSEDHEDHRWIHRLFFDPSADKVGLHRDSDTQGDVIGYQAIYATCVITEMEAYAQREKHADLFDVADKIGESICRAMKACQKLFDLGIVHNWEIFDSPESYRLNLNKNLAKAFKFADTDDENIPFEKGDIKTYYKEYQKIGSERIPVANSVWSILTQSAEYNLLGIAVDVVKRGIDKALNKRVKHSNEELYRPVWAPVVKFGEKKDLVVVDRREIESYRVVHELMSKAITDPPGKPLSIAVFGPPGSGKSFTVKRLLQSAEPESDVSRTRFFTINLAQQIDIKKLEEFWKDAESAQKDGQVPVLFFDEFDSQFGEQNLGWIKYFLGKMEDWENAKEDSRGNKIKSGSPIFVFAGGTSHKYEDFCREDSSKTEQEHLDFVMAKGPDFVSRLRGHINILGPNRVDEHDGAFVIRRAILLRENLRERLNIKDPKANLDGRVDDAIIKAMLKISSFKHGARSMRAILNMGFVLGGQEGRLVSSTMPTLPQLNMHVNGNEFLDMVIEESRNGPQKRVR